NLRAVAMHKHHLMLARESGKRTRRLAHVAALLADAERVASLQERVAAYRDDEAHGSDTLRRGLLLRDAVDIAAAEQYLARGNGDHLAVREERRELLPRGFVMRIAEGGHRDD